MTQLHSLLTEAADTIEEGAECLRQAYSVQGEWHISGPEDERAKIAYEQETALVTKLRHESLSIRLRQAAS